MAKRGRAMDSPFDAANHVDGVKFIIGNEVANVRNVALQLKGPDKKDLRARGSVLAFISGDANGDTLIGTAPTSVVIGTDGLAIPLVAGKAFQLISEADGDIDLNITLSSGAATYYLVVVMPDGRLIVSEAISFVA